MHIFFSMREVVLRGTSGPRTVLERWQGPPHVNKEHQCRRNVFYSAEFLIS